MLIVFLTALAVVHESIGHPCALYRQHGCLALCGGFVAYPSMIPSSEQMVPGMRLKIQTLELTRPSLVNVGASRATSVRRGSM